MRDITYPPVIWTAKAAFKVMGLTIQVTGGRHVPTSAGAVLVLNHISYVDFVFGGLAAQPSKRLVRFMAKREVFDHKVSGPIMRSLHHIEVDRSDGLPSYQKAVEYLRGGEVVGVFPEATISRAFVPKDFKTGAVRMAAEAEVPVVPVVLWGTQLIYTKDHPRDFSRGKTILITVGEPMHPVGGNSVKETAELREAMSGLLDDAIHRYPEKPDGAWWAPRRYGGTAPTLEEARKLDADEKRRRAEQRRAKRAGKG